MGVNTSLNKENCPAVPGGLHPHWQGRLYAMLGLLGLLLLAAIFAISFGSVEVPFFTTISIIISKIPFIHISPDWTVNTQTIIWDIRLPRVLLAGVVGMALAVAGATYQGLFRNPLADPYLIGVAQGAAVGAVLGLILGIGFDILGIFATPLFAFVGAFGAVGVVYMLARVGNRLTVTTLILAGVALGSFLTAVVSYLITVSGDKIHSVMFWLMGSFSMAAWDSVKIVVPIVIIGTIVILLFARSLNLIQLGEEQAQELGVDVERMKIFLLTAATLITAAAVSFVGIIGFVGIIVPHAVRLIWGADYRFLLPLSALVGAVFMIMADIASRTLVAPNEIPVGAITALVGAPFFLYLLRKRTRMLF
ncbi:MAG: iron ABC transporter permease [Dehalococcoides mccartyi]|uniref:FecCD family ABC transporter permease n=1 Tax=Dehalococcoides mccartyi TaxID=61435 RepID=UPI0025C8C842|nr:iron ABC transporter permease [Dehalococcoides mccartyi]MDN4185773.1 iron ABC transporter permease [Dehalococcoides mccartyi]